MVKVHIYWYVLAAMCMFCVVLDIESHLQFCLFSINFGYISTNSYVLMLTGLVDKISKWRKNLWTKRMTSIMVTILNSLRKPSDSVSRCAFTFWSSNSSVKFASLLTILWCRLWPSQHACNSHIVLQQVFIAFLFPFACRVRRIMMVCFAPFSHFILTRAQTCRSTSSSALTFYWPCLEWHQAVKNLRFLSCLFCIVFCRIRQKGVWHSHVPAGRHHGLHLSVFICVSIFSIVKRSCPFM